MIDHLARAIANCGCVNFGSEYNIVKVLYRLCKYEMQNRDSNGIKQDEIDKPKVRGNMDLRKGYSIKNSQVPFLSVMQQG